MIEKAFLEFGYTKEEFMEIRNSYAIASYTDETLLKKFIDINQFLLNNDYTKEEIKRMTISYPVIYSYSIENMQRKIENMILLGYKREEVLKMTALYPEIYGLNIENIKQKIDFYDSINMHQLVIMDPKILMQSVAVSYARYQFYLSKGIIIDINNRSKLFVNNKYFEKLMA